MRRRDRCSGQPRATGAGNRRRVPLPPQEAVGGRARKAIHPAGTRGQPPLPSPPRPAQWPAGWQRMTPQARLAFQSAVSPAGPVPEQGGRPGPSDRPSAGQSLGCRPLACVPADRPPALRLFVYPAIACLPSDRRSARRSLVCRPIAWLSPTLLSAGRSPVCPPITCLLPDRLSAARSIGCRPITWLPADRGPAGCH